jgi:Uma2 family endonuclease
MTVEVDLDVLTVVDKHGNKVLDFDLLQGLWTEEQYLKLTNATSHLIEYTDGVIEVLPIPTPAHQQILALLYELFVAFVRPRGGIVLFSPLRVRVRPGTFREPDLVVLQDSNDARQLKDYWLGVDLAVEVISEDNPERDTKVKRADYAQAGVPEYWIVDPFASTITVLALHGSEYVELGVFGPGQQAYSQLFAGFMVAVDEVLPREA